MIFYFQAGNSNFHLSFTTLSGSLFPDLLEAFSISNRGKYSRHFVCEDIYHFQNMSVNKMKSDSYLIHTFFDVSIFFADQDVQEEETGRGLDEEALQMNLAFLQGKRRYKIWRWSITNEFGFLPMKRRYKIANALDPNGCKTNAIVPIEKRLWELLEKSNTISATLVYFSIHHTVMGVPG